MAYGIGTKCLYGDGKKLSCDKSGAISFPIYQTATFERSGIGEGSGYDYSRMQNPTREQLENTVAALEKGFDAVAFSSGMAAISAVFELFNPNDHIITDMDLYGGSIRLFDNISKKNGITFDHIDFNEEDVEKYIKKETKALYIETPTNPMMNIIDIEEVSKIAKKHNLLLIVDNTFLSPYFQNPIELGADIVIHSGTKFLGGHNDTIAGFVVSKDEEVIEKIRFIIKTTGACLSPMDSWLILRGIKTLGLRMEKAQENAIKLAKWISNNKKVKNVYYPGLEDSKGYEICKKQARGFGSMITFEVESKELALSILKNVEVIHFAESLGGVESLITYPITQTHADVPPEKLEKNKITDKVLRLSVGIEDIEDLISEFIRLFEEEGLINDFDRVIDRKNTDCLKYDFAQNRGMPEDVLPLWVADMDFEIPKRVKEEIIKRTEHGIFGYTESKESYFEALENWLKKRHDFNVSRRWLVKTPGVVYAIAMAINAFTKEGDAVLIQEPVYYPFGEVITDNKREKIVNTLKYVDGEYGIDFKDFEEKIRDNKVKIFVLCSPHNPVGRVWREDELSEIIRICKEYNVLIISDEIHMDFVYEGNKHRVLLNVAGDEYDNIILCTSPSKTFNLAGLQVSNIFIRNDEIRRAFKREISKTGYSQLNTLGLTACEAAYRHGEEWLKELLVYLQNNLDIVDKFVKENLKGVKLVKPEGTYLVWLDFRELNISQKELDDIIIHKARLWLDGGTMFGDGGEGFQRINIACPKSTLIEALNKLKIAFN